MKRMIARPPAARAKSAGPKPSAAPTPPMPVQARKAVRTRPGFAFETLAIHPRELIPAGLGRPLPGPLQRRMESYYRHDFSRVRVHEDRKPDAIAALAFTRGDNIHFAPGQYAPHSRRGQEMIGHELAHVVQQRSGRVAVPGGGSPVNEEPALEREADRCAAQSLTAPIRGGNRVARSAPPASSSMQPIQPMPKWKRYLWNAAKIGGVAAAAGGALMMGGVIGAGLLGATAAKVVGAGLVAGGAAGAWGAHKASSKTAEQRVARWHARDAKRDRFPTGQFLHAAGPVTISGVHDQRISQTNKLNYNDATLGSMPPYSGIQAELNYPGASRAIHDPGFVPPPGLTDRQRIATALAPTLSNVSEADKAPGIDKAIRAFSRRHSSNNANEHPLDPAINPAVTSAVNARDFMEGRSGLTAAQRDAVDNYASDSSDDEDEAFASRTGMLKKVFGPEKKSRRRRR